MSRGLIVALFVAVFLLLPEAAHACPVCFDSRDENRQAFLATTVLLSLLPLGMVGGVGFWMRRRVGQMERDEGGLAEQDEASPRG